MSLVTATATPDKTTLDEVFGTQNIEEQITLDNYEEKGYKIGYEYDETGRCRRAFQKIDKSIVHVQLTPEQLLKVSPLVGFFANLNKNSK